MSTVRKFNPETEEWVTVASDSASGVFSSSSTLIEEGEEKISVEDALIRDREDIEKMKKNISWLALHGGNGSGGGGGGVEVTNTITFLDRGNPTNNIIWRDDSKSVSYQINSSKASNRFNVVITLDGVTIDSKNNIGQGVNTVNIKKINAYSNSTRHTLRISAVDLYDNAVVGQCSITQITINIDKVTDHYFLNLNEVEGSMLSITYQASVNGEYILYWSDDANVYDDPMNAQYGHMELIIQDGFAKTLSIPYWTVDDTPRLLRTNIVQEGQTLKFYFVLVSAEDATLKSKRLDIDSTVLSPDNLAIQPLFLSTDKHEPTDISKASVLGSNFIVYLQSASVQYNYSIIAHKVNWNENTDTWDVIDTKNEPVASGIGQYGVVSIVTYNALPNDSFFEGGYTYKISIYAEDRINPSKQGSADSYVTIQEASDNIIPLNIKYGTIFDYNIWGTNDINRNSWQWTYENNEYSFNGSYRTVSTTANMYNMGGKSDIYPEHCRLTNKAYMVINKSTVNGTPISWIPTDAVSNLSGLISSGGPQFTLTLSFFNDYTPNDDRTIFNWGNYVPKTYDTVASGYGILINNHDFYIRFGERLITGKLLDSIYHEIDIVFGENNASASGSTSVKVYHNGTLLALDQEVRVSDIFAMNAFNEMSIACNKSGNSVSQYTNISLQSISLYSIALNPFQIVCNWINHLVTYQLEDNSLNTTLLNQKLNSNLITATEIDGEKVYTSPLWSGSDFNTSDWIAETAGELAPADRLAEICPIPIIILDFRSHPDWNWQRFTQTWASDNPQRPCSQPDAEGVPIYFYPGNGGGNVLNGTTVKVSGQGTTSLTYEIKNLDIDFGENRLFWAKQDWFPERVYTLKADVVDSAHANNATIGRFINACARNTNLVEKTPPMTYFDNNKSGDSFHLPTTALDLNNGVKVRHTLEGFPVLLLVKFYTPDGGGQNKSLGIYSFNLGRKSYFNMGFQVLKNFRDVDGNILSSNVNAPYLLGAPLGGIDIVDFNAQSWEGKDSINCKPKTAETESELRALTQQETWNDLAPVELNGYFWSSYPYHIEYFWESKYPEGGVSVTEGFQDLCREIVSLYYTKGDYSNNRGIFYQYDWDNVNKKMYIPQQVPVGVDRINASSIFNRTNAAFYYVICMLFGLVDSLGKNLNMRIWKNTHVNGLDPLWYTCFYDMDTALGIDNIGNQIVDPDVCDEELENNPSFNKKFAYGHDFSNAKMYTVRDNKLWGVLDCKNNKDQWGGVGGSDSSRNSVYAKVWNLIRTNYLLDAETFVDDYFGMQTENIGELLYNQDFDIKYVGTGQRDFMYGDRKAFVKDWITKRIQFLDGYFGYTQEVDGGADPYLTYTGIKDISYKNVIKITHNSGTEYLPFISKAPCVVRSKIGAANTYYYYLPANTPVNVKVANSGNSPGIQTEINYSDMFLEIEDLANLAVQSLDPEPAAYIDTGDYHNVHELYSTQFGALSSFSKFNISGNKSFKDNGIDFIKLFKTWNEGENTQPYALTELDLSNTKNNTISNFPLNLTSAVNNPMGSNYYENPFENLTDINLTNSCVTSVVLPQNVALFSLQLANSAVTRVSLNGQAVLTNVDFTGCSALREVILDDCSVYKKLTLNSLASLSTVQVMNCPEIEEIYINVNGRNTPLNLYVDNVPKLKKISVINAYSPDCVLVLNAQHLEQLILTGCQFTHIIVGAACKSDLRHLDLSNSLVKAINWGASNIDTTVDVLDIHDCGNLINGGVNIAYNIEIEKIQLPNNEYDPVPLNFSFVGCKNLTRVFGNYIINSADTFRDCPKFTIHGGIFNGQTTENKPLTPPAGYNIITYNTQFQSNLGTTNLSFGTSAPRNCFYNTSCDAFDVYYALWKITPNVTDITGMFSYCKRIKMNWVSSTDNSPDYRMFENCTNVTTVSNLFYSCDIGPFRIFSKTTNRNGLLSPLKKCSDFSGMFYGSKYAIDRHVFRTYDYDPNSSSNPYYANGSAINLYNFNPYVIINDINQLPATAYNIFSDPESFSNRGRLVDDPINKTDSFYEQIQVLASGQYIFSGVEFLDYDYFAPIPTVGSIFGSYNSNKATGTITIKDDDPDHPYNKLCKNPSQINSIVSSFTAQEGDATVTFTDNSFLEYTNLQRIDISFLGNGITKLIGNDYYPGFCYDILHNCKNSISVFNLFEGARMFDNAQVDIPGTLFRGCVNLERINRCFSGFESPIRLTSDGFIDCTKLTNVSNLFSRTNIRNYIPNKLFNLGFTEQTASITGTNDGPGTIDVDVNAVVDYTPGSTEVRVTEEILNDTRTITKYENIDYDSSNRQITYTPVSTYVRTVDEWNGTNWARVSNTRAYVAEYSDWTTNTVPIIKKTPRAKISDISSCFSGCNIPYYVHQIVPNGLDPDIEYNPDYCPFEYTYKNGTWSKSEKNDYQYTYMWAYDGFNRYSDSINQYYLPDPEITEIKRNSRSGSYPAYINYCCAPDLLRWCIPTAHIEGLFNNSTTANVVENGPTGRIPPYLLKPVYETKSISRMFSECISLSSYKTSDSGWYLIPEDFFKYAPNITDLSYAFAEMDFLKDSALTNFAHDLTGPLVLDYVFHNCRWVGGTQNDKFILSGVFRSNKVVSTYAAFCVGTPGNPNSGGPRDQYVSFSDIFSTNNTIHVSSNDWYVFYGYREGYVTHELNHTVSDIGNRNNYTTVQ